MNGSGQRASLGGEKVGVGCPHCGHEFEVLDQRFLRYGPVRCGACGEVIQGSATGLRIAVHEMRRATESP